MPFIHLGVARGYRRKRFYSTSVRILTHLSSTNGHEPGTLSVLTQEGIAAATHSGRTTATKWLSRLEAAGLIAGDRAHVPGHRVRKTVYRLTHAGWVEARVLRERFQSDIVEVLAPELAPTQMRVTDIPEIFPAYVNLTATVSLVRRGRLDFTKLHGIGSGAVAPVLWGDTVRRTGRVFGRVEESRALDAWCASSSPFLVVTGLPGIGKSSLVADWLVQQRPRPYLYWFEIHEGTTRAIFLRDLAAFLARLGRRGLTNLLGERRAEDLAVTERVLAHDVRGLPILCVLDNFHAAMPDLAGFVTGPVLRLFEEAAAKLLLISRTVPSAVQRRRGSDGPRVEILPLGGLRPGPSVALLRSKGFAGDETALQRAATSAKGHPILLSFAAQTGAAVGGAIARYLDEEISRTLTRDERTILEAASLFRGLVPLDSLHCFSKGWQSAIHGLQAKNLLAPTISGGVVVHETIREYIVGRISEVRRRSFHSLAAGYFLDSSEGRDRLEGMYHLIEAGEAKPVGEYLVSHGSGLLDSVPATELLRLLQSISAMPLESVPACLLPELKGDALRASGDLQPALLEYRHAVQRAESESRPERIPRLLRKVASIERCRDEPSKALGYLVEAQARLERHSDASERGEILREMALVEQTRGDLAQASSYMNESVDLATEVSEPSALSRSLTALGMIEERRGNAERALEFRLEGLRIAERGGNLTETARASISVGVSLHNLGRLEETLKYYDRAAQIARVVGNIRLLGIALMNRGGAMAELGLYREAVPIHEEAKRLATMLQERSTIALLEIGFGQLEMGLGHWNRAQRLWERGLSELKRLGDRFTYAQSLCYVARFHIEYGDAASARKFVEEAEAVARDLGGTVLTQTVEEVRRRLADSQNVGVSTSSRAST